MFYTVVAYVKCNFLAEESLPNVKHSGGSVMISGYNIPSDT